MSYTNDSSQSSRIVTIDVMKGVLIVGIVILHLVMLSGPFNYRVVPLFLQCVYLGLMCFFVVSGYFFRPDKSFKENIEKRFKQLLVAIVIVTLVLSTVMYLWMMVWGKAPSIDDLIWTFEYGFGLSELGLDPAVIYEKPICLVAITNYFMWVMLISFVVFYATAKRVISDKRIFAVAVISLLVVQCILAGYFRHILPFFIHLVPTGIIFMYSGAYVAKYHIIERIDALPMRDLKKWIPLPLFAFAAAVLVWIFPDGCGYDLMVFGTNGGFSVFTFYVESILMFVVYVYVCAIISKIPLVSSFFTLSGKHTLALTFLHGFVAKIILVPFYTFTIETVFPSEMSQTSLFFLSLLTIAIILIGCYLKELAKKSTAKRRGLAATE